MEPTWHSKTWRNWRKRPWQILSITEVWVSLQLYQMLLPFPWERCRIFSNSCYGHWTVNSSLQHVPSFMCSLRQPLRPLRSTCYFYQSGRREQALRKAAHLQMCRIFMHLTSNSANRIVHDNLFAHEFHIKQHNFIIQLLTLLAYILCTSVGNAMKCSAEVVLLGYTKVLPKDHFCQLLIKG